MKKSKKRTILLLALPVFFMVSAYSQEAVSASVAKGLVSLQVAANESENESSKIVGLEGAWNMNPNDPIVVALHAAYQKQNYGSFSESRYALGISGNYYFDYSEELTVNLGLKLYSYTGMGNTEEALDCLYCSNVEEDYGGKNSYLTLGFNFDQLYLGVDYRVSDHKSDWSENASDPWGVGSSYRDNFEGIPDPNYIINIGYLFRH